MRLSAEGTYHLTISDDRDVEGEPEEGAEEKDSGRTPIPRSREMWTVALYLSKFGDSSSSDSEPGPPARLLVDSWNDAYDLFLSSTGDGRTQEAFRRSMKNARDAFDSHVEESGREGWQQGDGTAPLGSLALEVWNTWGHRDESALWEEIQRILTGLPSLSESIGDTEADDEIVEATNDDPFQRIKRSIRQRRGQTDFRNNLLKVYDHRCVITGHGPVAVLEAAHIEPHSVSGQNSTDNGLLLRADLHTLMDVGLLAIDPTTMKVLIHVGLMGTPYDSLVNVPVREPSVGYGPNKKYLEQRYDSLVRDARSDFLPIANSSDSPPA